MAKQGYIKLYRQVQDNWIYSAEKFDKFHAWIDLLLLAEHQEHKRLYKGEVKTFEAGTVNISLTKLADRWGWSRKKVRTFLTALEKDEMCTLKVSTNDTTIKLVNYSKFQGFDEARNRKRNSEGISEGINEGNISNNVKNDKNNIYTSPPKKDMFQEAIDRYNERVANGEYDLSGIEKENEDD